MPRIAVRPAPCTASRLALAAALSLSLAACQDVTAPVDGAAANRIAPSAAVVRSTSGQYGDVRTPYPSVQCWGPAATDYRVSVRGATAYPAQMMSSGERVTQQVYLYRWTSAGWSAIASRTATRSVGPVVMPAATFSYLTQGHYKVVTRFTWQLYTSAGWTTIGTKIVDYNQAIDYNASYGAAAQTGFCTL